MANVRQHFKYAVTGKFDSSNPQEMPDSQITGSKGGSKTPPSPPKGKKGRR